VKSAAYRGDEYDTVVNDSIIALILLRRLTGGRSSSRVDSHRWSQGVVVVAAATALPSAEVLVLLG